jgi:thiamine pyrophosphate-dependent acetolactate synthase large subunit-like protein
VLALPLDVQAAEAPAAQVPGSAARPAAAGAQRGLAAVAPAAAAVSELVAALRAAERPVFIAGRGARVARARGELERLADACGALLATSAAAKGLFAGSPWNLDVSGGFASPLAAELITGADLIVSWGCGLNMWTTRHGGLVGPGAAVVQVDLDAAAIGAHRPADLGVVGDVAATAAAAAELTGPAAPGYRSARLRERIADEIRWRDVRFKDESDGDHVDPRALSIALDDMLPAQRVVAVDSGNFMGYPSMYLSVPDADAFCFTQSYQSVGLGLASAIGAGLAAPHRLPVAALGDGGALMGVSELETVVRLGLPMVIVVYDDEAYGAEVHHFGPSGHPLDTVRFPPADIAAIGRGFGCEGITVRDVADLAALGRWLDGPRDRPVVIDAKVTAEHGSWWLEEAFRGH